MRKTIVGFCTLSLGVGAALFACSEAATPAFGTDAGSSPAVDSGGPADAGSKVDATPGPGDSGACGFNLANPASLPLVVNELRAKGKEFVELYNPTSNVVDLSGAKLVDLATDGGCPKLDSAVVFPPGTKVPAGAYVVVFTGQADASVGPYTACFDAGVAKCFYATYGLSNSSGDSVVLMNSADAIVAGGDYPPAAVDAGESWGRLPNGTGSFQKNTPTPGAANLP